MFLLGLGCALAGCGGDLSDAPDECTWRGGACSDITAQPPPAGGAMGAVTEPVTAQPSAGTAAGPMQNASGGSGPHEQPGAEADGSSAGTGGAASDGTGGSAAVNEDAGSGGADTDAGTAGTDAGGNVGTDAGNPPVDAGQPDAGPQVPQFTLVVATPKSGETLSGKVAVSGWAPGFRNVEVWDATHQKPPLGQVVPAANGRFELEVDVEALASGSTTWTVHAWDSAPGQTFTNTDSVVLQLEIKGAGGPADDNGTPDPGTKYVPTGYQLTFSDEFNGTTLDTAKWNTLAPWGVQFYADSKQKQAFVPQAVSVAGGVVTFTARRSDGSNTNGQPYSSGSITSNGTFTHGYYEARVKVPSGKGFWPAYWVTSKDRWPPEWDIFEIIDGTIFGYPHPINSGLCRFVEGAAGGDSTYVINNLYDVYHVYGFHWTSSDLYWYVDGVLTEHWQVDAAAGSNDPFWVNLSLQVGGDWPGDPDGSTPFPGRMEVDYVRIYQQP